VGGSLAVVDVVGLTGLLVGELATIGGDLSLEGNLLLTEVDLGMLTAVEGQILLRRNPELGSLELPALTRAAAIAVGADDTEVGHEHLEALHLPSLTSLGSLRLHNTPTLREIEAPKLDALGGELLLAGGCAAGPSGLVLATAGSLRLEGQCGLGSLDFLSSLTSLGADAEGSSLVLTGLDGLSGADLEAFSGGIAREGSTRIEPAPPGCAEHFADTYGVDMTTACAAPE
jgi:hypothetical protein